MPLKKTKVCCCEGEGALLVSLRGASNADCGRSPGFRTCGRCRAAPLPPAPGFCRFPGAAARAAPGPRTRSPRAARALPSRLSRLEAAAPASATGAARQWLLTFAWEQSQPHQSVSTSCKRTWRSIVCKAVSRTAGKIQIEGEDPVRRKGGGGGGGGWVGEAQKTRGSGSQPGRHRPQPGGSGTRSSTRCTCSLFLH